MDDTTIIFRLADKRLTDEERKTVLELSRKLYTRDTGTATTFTAEKVEELMRKLPEAHHRVDRGDL
jgi:hypothetical protein